MKCLWKNCNGLIGEEGRCIFCGRSSNLEYEKKINKLQHSRKHHNWHGKPRYEDEHELFKRR